MPSDSRGSGVKAAPTGISDPPFLRGMGRVNTPRPEPSGRGCPEIMPKTPLSYPATNDKAGGKLPAGNDTIRFPARSFSEASRKAATNHPSRRALGAPPCWPRGTTALVTSSTFRAGRRDAVHGQRRPPEPDFPCAGGGEQLPLRSQRSDRRRVANGAGPVQRYKGPLHDGNDPVHRYNEPAPAALDPCNVATARCTMATVHCAGATAQRQPRRAIAALPAR